MTQPGLSLAAYREENAFKLFALDVGLLAAAGDLSPRTLIVGDSVFAEFKGALTEQYVCQQLAADTEFTPFYFTWDRCEVDFLIQGEPGIVPIEVKAEKNQRSRSLRAYCGKHSPARAVRLSMAGCRDESWLTNIPLYAIHCLPGILAARS